MQENIQAPMQSAGISPPSQSPPQTLLADAATLVLNRAGRLTPDQLRQLGNTISLARWLLYPLGASLVIVIFAAGLFGGALGYALHLSFQVMAAFYGLLLVSLLIMILVIGNRGTLIRFVIVQLLGAGFAFLVFAYTRSIQPLVLTILLVEYLAVLGGIGWTANGDIRDLPDKSRRNIFLATIGLLCLLLLALWFLSSFAILVLFSININWEGLVIIFGLFYLLGVWATADEYFKGRAIRRNVVARTGEVIWDASKGKFVARVGRKIYQALGTLPAPGRYRFYCLPSIAHVVSAEPLTEVDLSAQM